MPHAPQPPPSAAASARSALEGLEALEAMVEAERGLRVAGTSALAAADALVALSVLMAACAHPPVAASPLSPERRASGGRRERLEALRAHIEARVGERAVAEADQLGERIGSMGAVRSASHREDGGVNVHTSSRREDGGSAAGSAPVGGMGSGGGGNPNWIPNWIPSWVPILAHDETVGLAAADVEDEEAAHVAAAALGSERMHECLGRVPPSLQPAVRALCRRPLGDLCRRVCAGPRASTAIARVIELTTEAAAAAENGRGTSGSGPTAETSAVPSTSGTAGDVHRPARLGVTVLVWAVLDTMLPSELCALCAGDRRPLCRLLPAFRRALHQLVHPRQEMPTSGIGGAGGTGGAGSAGGAGAGNNTGSGLSTAEPSLPAHSVLSAPGVAATGVAAPGVAAARAPMEGGGSSNLESARDAIGRLVDEWLGSADGWSHSRWMLTHRARTSASARGLATIGAACHRRCRALLIDVCLFAYALPPTRRFSAGVCDAWGRFAHRLLRAWEAELRMGSDDAAALLGGAIERAWAVGVPSLAPLAPLASALVRGHMLRCFVPAYSEYTLAEERRLPPPSAGLPPVLPLAPFDLSLPPLVLPSGGVRGGGAPAAGPGLHSPALQRAFWIEMIENGVEE